MHVISDGVDLRITVVVKNRGRLREAQLIAVSCVG